MACCASIGGDEPCQFCNKDDIFQPPTLNQTPPPADILIRAKWLWRNLFGRIDRMTGYESFGHTIRLRLDLRDDDRIGQYIRRIKFCRAQ